VKKREAGMDGCRIAATIAAACGLQKEPLPALAAIRPQSPSTLLFFDRCFMTDALTRLQELEDRLAAAQAAEKAALAKLARLNHEPRLELVEFNLRLAAARRAREASDAIYAELKAHLQKFNYKA
jgi:hypothetical protein